MFINFKVLFGPINRAVGARGSQGGLTSLTDFYKPVHLLLKNIMRQIAERKSLLSK